MKPAQQTPLSMLALGQILEEAGLPGGVFNILTTSSSGSTTGPLIQDPRLRKLSFTGSTEVGRKLIEASAQNVLKVSMELGGNAPFLIFEDADLDAASGGGAAGEMRNMARPARRPTASTWRAGARGVRPPCWRSRWAALSSAAAPRRSEGRSADRPASREKVAELVQDCADKGATRGCRR